MKPIEKYRVKAKVVSIKKGSLNVPDRADLPREKHKAIHVPNQLACGSCPDWDEIKKECWLLYTDWRDCPFWDDPSYQ